MGVYINEIYSQAHLSTDTTPVHSLRRPWAGEMSSMWAPACPTGVVSTNIHLILWGQYKLFACIIILMNNDVVHIK